MPETPKDTVHFTGAKKGDILVNDLATTYSGLLLKTHEDIPKRSTGNFVGFVEVIDVGDGKHSEHFKPYVNEGPVDAERLYSDVMKKITDKKWCYFLHYSSLIVKDRIESIAEQSYFEDTSSIIQDTSNESTVKETLVLARIGQGQFRRDVLEKFDQQCCVTGSKTVEAIRASHIKPWKDCTNDERLDSSNGLPLLATLDALFDRGLITFSESGKMKIASRLSKLEEELLGLSDLSIQAEKIGTKTKAYLEWHRKNRFK